MKKTLILAITLILLLSLSGCLGNDTQNNGKLPNDSLKKVSDKQKSSSNATKQSPEDGKSSDTDLSKSNGEEYPHDVAKDRKKFSKKKKAEIIFKDNNYVSLINDCYINPTAYVGKTVEIEGFYIWDGLRTYVGRKGPTCPCCTTGFVGMEYHGDNMSVINDAPPGSNGGAASGIYPPDVKNPDPKYDKFTIGDTWIKVRGYIRQGNDPTVGSFTYIEAITVEAMSEKGTETVN
ncbi:MAG: hypothetical protein PUK14_06460 [Clostridiales bacterium]|nr:hypothetical protein [Clostridiales bacterium]